MKNTSNRVPGSDSDCWLLMAQPPAYYDPSIGRYLRADPIGLAEDINLFFYTQNNPINAIDPFGLETWQCSRKLGGPYKPAANKNWRIRHDYIRVGDEYYSFGSVGDSIKGPGKVSLNTENDEGIKCHTKISDDENYDEIVREIAENYMPRYNIRACESQNRSDTPCVFGHRNCKSWVVDVIEKARKRYEDRFGKETQCFSK